MSYMQWMVAEDSDGAYLTNNLGYIATPIELKSVIDELVRFASERSDYIACKNAELDEYYENLRNGKYTKANESTPICKKRYLYMFKSGKNRYKIGVTTNVERRLKELNDRPYPVELFAVSDVPFYRAFEVEREMHELHADQRISGEWFEIDDECAELTACIIESADDDYDNGRGD